MDAGAAARIARLCVAGERDARVLEIGAGTGTLTQALLAEGAEVTAIEIDPELVALLRSREELRGARIIDADALEFDYESYAQAGSWCVAGNLPYNVATPLILRFCEISGAPQSLTVMIQKDVAERLAAKPGTAAYGSLTVAVGYAMHVRREFTLGPGFFYPPPKVHSTVVRMQRRERPPVQPHDLTLFWKVVRGAFAYRRKTLANSLILSLGLDRGKVERAIATSNLSPEQRGERLDIDDFARLADALAQG